MIIPKTFTWPAKSQTCVRTPRCALYIIIDIRFYGYGAAEVAELVYGKEWTEIVTLRHTKTFQIYI